MGIGYSRGRGNERRRQKPILGEAKRFIDAGLGCETDWEEVIYTIQKNFAYTRKYIFESMDIDEIISLYVHAVNDQLERDHNLYATITATVVNKKSARKKLFRNEPFFFDASDVPNLKVAKTNEEYQELKRNLFKNAPNQVDILRKTIHANR